jgi:hypothetical protein
MGVVPLGKPEIDLSRANPKIMDMRGRHNSEALRIFLATAGIWAGLSQIR